jgi:DNA-binding NarL/FixJ family response regulator
LSSVVFFTSDLHFSSRVLGAASALGVACKVVAQPEQLASAIGEGCRLVLVDLMMPGLALPELVSAVRAVAPVARIVAFGPHVDEALLASAQQAGCDLVLARSQFHKQYVDLLREVAGPV